LPPSSRARDSTGGAPAYSTRCFGPARSSHYARLYDDYSVPTPCRAPLSMAMEYRPVWKSALLVRFTLTFTIILIPQSLAIHGFEADQIGPAIIWSAIPLLPVALIAGLLLRSGVDPRLVFAAGLTCTASRQFLRPILQFVGRGKLLSHRAADGRRPIVALIGLVGGIVLQGVFTGGLSKPQWILTFSASFIPLDCLEEPRGPYTWAIFSPTARSCTRISWVCT